MANRVNVFQTFAGLAPPWSLPALDSNFAQITTAFNDPSLGYVNGFLIDAGTANNYIVTPTIGTASQYTEGMTIYFWPLNHNSTASTLTVNPLGAQPILGPGGNPLLGYEIYQNRVTGVVYHSGSGFWLMPPVGFVYEVSNPGNLTFNVKGYARIGIYVLFTVNTSCQVNLTNLDPGGTEVQVTFTNAYSAGNGYAIACGSTTTLDYQVVTAFPSSVTGSAEVIMQNGVTVNPFVLSAGATISYTGITVPGPILPLTA